MPNHDLTKHTTRGEIIEDVVDEMLTHLATVDDSKALCLFEVVYDSSKGEFVCLAVYPN